MLQILQSIHTRFTPSDCIRRLLLSWLVSASVEYAIACFPLYSLSGIAQMSLIRMLIILAICFGILNFISLIYNTTKWERVLMMPVFMALWIPSLIYSFNTAYMIIGLLICILMIPYVMYGQERRTLHAGTTGKSKKFWLMGTALASIGFFLFVSFWTVGRVMTFSSPSYDFGIFSQMFYYMKTTGLPYSTLERDGLLSHFCVHVSPIYYLLLPIYLIFPYPATLQVLQAAVLASAVIPLWLVVKQHGFSSPWRFGFCLLLLLYPAYSAGAGYDIHENAFLTPLILWLFYGIERRTTWLTCLFALLTLMIKEDSAVYVAIIGLWLSVSAIVGKKTDKKAFITGVALLFGAVLWFGLVTNYLAKQGQGVMTYRYNNLITDGSNSLLSVIQTVFLCPMKAVYECVDMEKLPFIATTLLPLLGIPLITRRYDRLILLIPYLLVNLMSDYRYQHEIFFQYAFGSTACLIYLTVVNLRDLYERKLSLLYKTLPLLMALTVSGILFGCQVVPTAVYYPQTVQTYESYYSELSQMLDSIPEDASVSATTFYTAWLSQRDIIYDVRYSSRDHTLHADYIVINPNASSCLQAYGGYEAFVKTITKHGYILVNKGNGVEIYKKQVS